MSLIFKNRIFPTGIFVRELPSYEDSENFRFYSLPDFIKKDNFTMKINAFYIPPNGLSLFTIWYNDNIGYNVLSKYNLSTPFDLSTATFQKSTRLQINSDVSRVTSLCFLGNKLFVAAFDPYRTTSTKYSRIIQYNVNYYDFPNQYSLNITASIYIHTSSAYPIYRGVTASHDGQYLFTITNDGRITKLNASSYNYIYQMTGAGSLKINEYIGYPTFSEVSFSDDGSKIFITTDNYVLSFDLPSPYDINLSPVSGELINNHNYRSIGIESFTDGISNREFAKSTIRIIDNGTKMLLNRSYSDKIYNFQLKNNLNISDIKYTGRSININVSGSSYYPLSIFFKSDGTKFYTCYYKSSSDQRIIQYNLATPWDISSYDYNPISLTLPFGNILYTYPNQLVFSSNGMNLYIVASKSNDNKIYKITLNTPWDIGSGVNSYTSYPITDENNISILRGIYFKPDGSKVYLTTGTKLFEYNLMIPWDISTISYSGNSYDFASDNFIFYSFLFKNNGKELYILMDGIKYHVLLFNLTEPWNISTATFANKAHILSLYMSSYTSGNNLNQTIGNLYSFFISSNGKKMFELFLGSGAVKIYELDILS